MGSLPAAVFEVVQILDCVEIHEAIGAALREARGAKEARVISDIAVMPILSVAFHGVRSGERLDVRDAAEECADGAKSAEYVGVVDVLQHVGANDEVDALRQAEI